MPLYCANGAEYIGKATEEAWANHQSVLEQVESLPVGIDPTTYYTYDFLPPDSELTPCEQSLRRARDDEGQGPGTMDRAGTKSGGVRVEIDGVSRTFNEFSDDPFLALSETHLTLEPGEFVSVVGPSGCGKSTLMLISAGLLAPTTGQVRVDGEVLTKPMTDVGIAFQDHLLLDFRTAKENVLLQADIRKLDREALGRRTDELFEQLGLDDAAGKYPRQLSGGMRQRVSLARTVVHRPSMLMLDEPFGALDALTRLQVRHDLEQLWLRDRPTVLFVTHSVEEAVGLSDRIVVFSVSPGQVVDEITVDLPRPRPLALGDTPEYASYADRVFEHFESMGVLSQGGGFRRAEPMTEGRSAR